MLLARATWWWGIFPSPFLGSVSFYERREINSVTEPDAWMDALRGQLSEQLKRLYKRM
jgi:hypothetical protein